MGEQITLTGMVLSGSLIGDYDKRLVILTKEKGKITAFASGVRKPKSMLMAAAQPFSYGQFKLYEGYSAYRLVGAEIENYFDPVKKDLDAVCYGTYFCEFADYLLLEGNANKQALLLLYATFLAMERKKMPLPLIRRTFEAKMLALEGQGLSVFSCLHCGRTENLNYMDGAAGGVFCSECAAKNKNAILIHPSTLYTFQYIASAPLTSLYSFQLTEEVFVQFEAIMKKYVMTYIPKKFKSLEILEAMI